MLKWARFSQENRPKAMAIQLTIFYWLMTIFREFFDQKRL
jgi:hypothetical protein